MDYAVVGRAAGAERQDDFRERYAVNFFCWGFDDSLCNEIIKDNMLPPDCDIEALYQIACANLARDVEFVIGNTMYGAFAILADGYHEASSLCFRHIWDVCVKKLEDDLLIMVPSKDTVLFAPALEEEAVEKMKYHAEQVYELGKNRISNKVFLFTRDGKELLAYDETKH